MGDDISADLARIDAQYPGFPAPATWAGSDVDLSVWDATAADLADLRRDQPDVADGLRARALREAGIDTGAVEGLYTTDRGFTMTVADAAGLEEAADHVRRHKGDDVEALFRAQVHGYEMALDLVARGRPLTESWIRQLHQVITDPQETYNVITPQGPAAHRLPKGEYKKHPNHVQQPDGTTFAYAPVDLVGTEMARFVELANGDVVRELHPVTAAAWLHYALVRVHPFADGNGRVTRVVASLPLLRAASLPFKVPADRRDAYIRALEDADHGDAGALVRFTRDETLGSQRLVLRLARRTAAAEAPAKDSYLSAAGIPIPAYDAAALRLRSAAVEALASTLDQTTNAHTDVQTGNLQGLLPTPEGWRNAVEARKQTPRVTASTPAPLSASVRCHVQALVAKAPGSGADVRIAVNEHADDAEDFALSDIDPVISDTSRDRIRLWAEAVAATAAARLSAAVAEVRRANGYA